MEYLVVKSSRLGSPHSYRGPSCQGAGVEPGKAYENYAEALEAARLLSRYNPVGFVVTDREGDEVLDEKETLEGKHPDIILMDEVDGQLMIWGIGHTGSYIGCVSEIYALRAHKDSLLRRLGEMGEELREAKAKLATVNFQAVAERKPPFRIVQWSRRVSAPPWAGRLYEDFTEACVEAYRRYEESKGEIGYIMIDVAGSIVAGIDATTVASQGERKE